MAPHPDVIVLRPSPVASRVVEGVNVGVDRDLAAAGERLLPRLNLEIAGAGAGERVLAGALEVVKDAVERVQVRVAVRAPFTTPTFRSAAPPPPAEPPVGCFGRGCFFLQ